jgi:hypothetical protein
MADSVVWRKLSKKSRKSQADRFNAGEVNASMPGTVVEPLLTAGAVEELMRQCAAELMRQRGAELATADDSDLLGIWFKELKENGIPIPMSGQDIKVMPGSEAERNCQVGLLDGLCEATATLGDILATEAEEREEKQRALETEAAQAELEKQRKAAGARRKVYHSALNRHIQNCLLNDPTASALQVCRYLDEQDVRGIPPTWLENGNRELSAAYRNDPKVRACIDARVSKVRRDLKG